MMQQTKRSDSLPLSRSNSGAFEPMPHVSRDVSKVGMVINRNESQRGRAALGPQTSLSPQVLFLAHAPTSNHSFGRHVSAYTSKYMTVPRPVSAALRPNDHLYLIEGKGDLAAICRWVQNDDEEGTKRDNSKLILKLKHVNCNCGKSLNKLRACYFQIAERSVGSVFSEEA